jgi:hypothetical protein
MPGRNHSNDIFFHGDTLRPYACEVEGEMLDIRPIWKLVGFFPANDAGCASLQNHSFDKDFCIASTPSPTHEHPPSQSPSVEESEGPSSDPSLQPTPEESHAPSIDPTQLPTIEESQLPSSTPSQHPTGGLTPAPTDVEYPMNLPCIKPNSDCTNGAGPSDEDNNCMVNQVRRRFCLNCVDTTNWTSISFSCLRDCRAFLTPFCLFDFFLALCSALTG